MTYNIKIKVKALSVLVGLSFSLLSCKHKTKFDDFPVVSYSTTIAPIIKANCSSSGCHGDTGYVKCSLTSYLGLINGGIIDGSPEKSKVYTRIKSLDDGKVMPKKPYDPLGEKDIQLIYLWIGQGAKNN